MKTIRFLSLFVLTAMLNSCEKEAEQETTSEVEFYISLENSSFQKALKSLDDATKIVLTIQTSAGEATNYTFKEIRIYKLGSSYISQKVALRVGDYQLTEFFLLNNAGNVIYAAPLSGSNQGQNVANPLPIAFSITKDQITPVNVQVLSTANLTPDDFGLVGFPIIDVATFSFLVSVSEQGQLDSLIVADILVESRAYSYKQSLEAITTNIVTVVDGFKKYTLTISKTGYNSFVKTFRADSLKYHSTEPLVVELSKQPTSATVTDIDGNVYKTVRIGDQVWMAENLKTTKYNDGTAIANVTDNAEWGSLSTGAYCWYDNNQATYGDIYGALYNWYAVETGNLCPSGWHVPTDAEWTTLTETLGGEEIAGAKLKEAGTAHWKSPNTEATNETGFTALPGGLYRHTGGFFGIGIISVWWSATESSSGSAWDRDMDCEFSFVYRLQNDKQLGHSIRCLKD